MIETKQVRKRSDRRTFLKVAGGLGVVGLAPLAGCTMVQGSEAPSMSRAMSSTGLPMFGGSPKKPQSGEITINMVAFTDQTNNYHFFPHVAWVEPGTSVKWEHFVKKGASEARVHTTTAFTGQHFGVRLMPRGADGWDSGFMSGTGKMMSQKQSFFDADENGGVSNNYGKHVVNAESKQIGGSFTRTFQQPGVYLYYCENHYKWKMAGAVVVGNLGGGSKGTGWRPAMTADLSPIEDFVDGDALIDQLGELREFVENGGEKMEGM